MHPISTFALDLLFELSNRFNDDDRWAYAVGQLADFGFNALNIANFSPTTGTINWARSSMTPEWLETYAKQGYVDADPVVEQSTSTRQTLYVDAHKRAGGANSKAAIGLFNGLVNAGYHHLFSMAVPSPDGTACMVVLSSNHPDAEQMMVDQEREIRILATVLGTNLGAATREDSTMVRDLAPVLATTEALSPRETETLTLLARGLRNDQIADSMGIREVTVRTHLKSAREKLRAPTREAALVRALQMGVLPLPHYRKR